MGVSGLDRLPACPPGLAAALDERDAVVTSVHRDPPRVYARCRVADGELFAWYTTDGSLADMCAYEATVREFVGDRGTLVVPPLLAVGENWRLDPVVAAEPISGPVIDSVIEAASTIADLEIPPPPGAVGIEGGAAKRRRRRRVALSRLPIRDALRARRLLADSKLPRATSHGDFHGGHVLPAGGRVWVIDWEMTDQRPAGYDLLMLWAHLRDAADRERLFAGIVELVGPAHRAELLRMRYALAVLVIATKLSEDAPYNRDPEGARSLLAELSAIRAAAFPN